MGAATRKAVLCVSSYEKGQEFLRECRRQGGLVYLLTTKALESADWPRESIDEIFYLPDLYNRDDVIKGVSFLMRARTVDRIVALDDYDVEMVATLREHLRLPGMGETTARYFRDKLAMRMRARERGIPVPAFIHVLNYDALRQFMATVPPPWVLKPRSEASSVGIKKVHAADELWPLLDALGDRQSFYLLERFVPGEVYHVDTIISERRIVCAEVHEYALPPMSVAHEGGVFASRTVLRGSALERALQVENARVVAALGLVRGVTHIEFIKSVEDGRFYFLEAAARVGGANIVEMVQAATGINLWAEWARIEIAQGEEEYRLPEIRRDYGGVIISLAKQEWPDTSAYQAPQIFYRLHKKNHVGFVLGSPDRERLLFLLEEYRRRIYADFFAVLPPSDKPTS
ncbi:ATP-grasp domain-containing protein [bacterium]|nr:ATP-grasp domain-containing protein [bacterium]